MSRYLPSMRVRCVLVPGVPRLVVRHLTLAGCREMKVLSRNTYGINVYGCASQKSQVFPQLGLNFGRNLMGVSDGHLRRNGDIEFSQKLVPQPARPNFGYIFNSRHVPGGVSEFFHYVGLYTIESADHYFLSTLIDDPQNRNRNQQPDDGIGFRVSEVNT